MGNIINLRQARKAKKRAGDESRAEVNRAKHGRSKVDKRIAAMAQTKLDAVVDGARRDRPDD